MKIAFFNAMLLNHGGGSEKHFIVMANEMARRGHQVAIFNLSKKFYNTLSIFLTFYYRSNQIGNLRFSNKEIKSFLKGVDWFIVKNLKDFKKKLKEFDVVYAKNEIVDLLVLKYVFGKEKLPSLIIGIHTPIFYPFNNSFQERFHNFMYLSFFYKYLLQIGSCFRVLNSDDKLLLEKFVSNKGKNIIKIPNPIDVGFFKPIKIKQEEDPRIFKILFVGRLNYQKGLDIFCKIINELSKLDVFKEFRFIIAGSGDLKYLAEKVCRLFKNVIYLDHVSQKNLPSLYSSCDVLVAPSRYETMHWVSLEAQSCGLPVIVTDIPGPREIIIDGKTGFLIRLEVEEFINKIIFLKKLKKRDPKKFQNYRINARQNIVEKFCYRIICDQLEELFLITNNKKKE